MTLRIYISADIEGVTDLVHFDETERKKSDFDIARNLMTSEVNAAIEGALEAGATDIVVRDAHGDARNIIPEKLNKAAQLIRGWADTPYCMMEGISEHFNAVMFVGYHAAAETPDSTLKHTMTLRVAEIRVNGILMAEAGLNALIAGMFNVPTILITGDKSVCDYARETFSGIETVAVKEGIGAAAINFHPEISRQKIKAGAIAALSRISEFEPFILSKPYEFVIRYRYEHSAFKASFYPGAERINNTTIRFISDELKDCFQFFYFCQG